MVRRKKKLFRPQRVRLTRPQWRIYEAGWTPEARFRTAVCGRRFGKTTLGIEEIRRACRLAVAKNIDPDNEIWYCAPYLNQARRVFWKRLKRGIPLEWIDGKPNESTLSITLKTGHVIRLVGLDNYDLLRGSGLWFALIDEWADCPYAAWTETLRPMLSTAGGHAMFVGTPKGFNHLYDSYQAGQPGAKDTDGNPITNSRSFLYTTEQGGNVPADEVAEARRNLDARTYRQEYQATFETFEGRVLASFTRAENVKPYTGDWSKLPLHVGMDFNINPMTAVVWVLDGDKAHQVDEVILPTSNTDEMADELTRRYGRLGFDGKPKVDHITIHPDPAGAQRSTSAQGKTDINILQGRGFKVLAMTSHPLVRDRINVSNARFCGADGIRRAFVDPRCKQSIQAYERHVYREGTNEPDKTLGFDHIVDAYGYFVYGHYAYQKPYLVGANLMGR